MNLEEKKNNSEIIDSFGAFNLYQGDDGYFEAVNEYSVYVRSISFFSDSYSIEVNESIVDYSDWEDCKDKVEEAFKAVEYFQDVINNL